MIQNTVKQGKTSIMMALALSIVVSSSLAIVLNHEERGNELTSIGMKFEEGIELLTTKSYEIWTNIKWSDIKATGVKITETNINGFLQICERLAFELGNLRIYADFECRLLWVYSDTDNSEVYYVQFK